MALGIVEPKSEEYLAEHGLLEYWVTERDHWQGKVAEMTEEEREATGTSLLETTVVDQAQSSSEAMSAAPAVHQAEAGSQPANAGDADQADDDVTTVSAPTSEARFASQGLSTGPSDTTETVVPVPPEEPEPVGDPVTPALSDANAGNVVPGEAESTAEMSSSPVVQEIQQAKTQEQLRQERLERFGSYTAYSLWRKIPAMALGIVEPKTEAYFAEHGLLDYWHTEKKHWQAQVAAMSLAERAATGTSLLDEI